MTVGRISVVIATHNLARYVPEAVDSALAQTHAEREIIVVDDGSTDDTAERLEPYGARIRYIKQDHGGLAAARNHGLRLATGDYIALLDADDIWKPEKLAIQLEIAQRRPRSGLIACDGYEFDGDEVLQARLFPGRILDLLAASPGGEAARRVHAELIASPIIACPAQTLIPRAVIDRLGPFADGGAQDYDYCLRIGQRYPITFHHHVLAGWRYRPDSMSGALDMRPLIWALYRLPVLGAHAMRCDDEADRLRIARTIDRVTREIVRGVSPRKQEKRPD